MSEPVIVEGVVVPTVMSQEQAREHTNRLKQLIQQGIELHETIATNLDIAWSQQTWKALGYENWETFCHEEFRDIRTTRMTTKSRKALVDQLTQRTGMSSRAIAAGIGVDQKTVIRDRASIESSAEVPRQTVRGTDGVERPARAVTRQKRTHLNDARQTLATLERVISDLESIPSSERWELHSDELGAALADQLLVLADRLAVVTEVFVLARRD